MIKRAGDELLVEIGTEELPPKALRTLMLAFADGVAAALTADRLAIGKVTPYASPRRLAVKIAGVAAQQEDREVEQKGPPVRIAFDKDGNPTKAAKAFAEKCGVPVASLEREQTSKGEWLVHRAEEPGRSLAELLPACVQRALDGLPIPRRMRWGANSAEFVRPVHWVVMLHGKNLIEGTVLGIAADRRSEGHRFMSSGPVTLKSTADYPGLLESQGHVIADFFDRRQRIVAAVNAAAAEAGGTAVADDALFDEVTALCEWPVAITGHFDKAFLELPKEVIVATLTSHQRYFPLVDSSGALLPAFITLANIDSREPDTVRDGNERVIRPRLADAAFFWDADRKLSLADRQAALDDVVYQRGLGSLGDKAKRVALLSATVAAQIDTDPVQAERAALLAKCDLVTGMVGEFPELQGTMGRYYALNDRETVAVADAISEHYLPRFAGDALPGSPCGQVLAVADKLDTLSGVFAAGNKPSGNRDPFGLRRAALGLVRIIVEGALEIDLPQLIENALDLQPVAAPPGAAEDIYDFIVERLRGWYLERDNLTAEMFEAVRFQRLPSLSDFDSRMQAVADFVDNEAAESLAAANKRIANILRQAEFSGDAEPRAALFTDQAEHALLEALQTARAAVADLVSQREYQQVLTRLAELRAPVDEFFEKVMVMADDASVRQNRLALLAHLRAEFLNVADISRLSIARS
ncbi:MAG: glycine--tRNA ligase subunit beta [Woeseia sp.]|nr:glycine--tRNA ligase subunit beta [Woeseia sp.]